MKGTMIILKAEEPTPPDVIEFGRSPELEALQKAVGGYLECVPQFDSFEHDGEIRLCVAFCNEEGKLKELPFNEPATRAWDAAFKRHGLSLFDEAGRALDVLCGDVAVLYGDAEFMESL